MEALNQILPMLNQVRNSHDSYYNVQIDRERWDLEYQQVAPKLQIRIGAEARDWRTHLDGVMQCLQSTFSEEEAQGGPARQQAGILWPQVKSLLRIVQSDVNEQLNKLETRERFLNHEFAARTEEFRDKKESFEASKVLLFFPP